MTTTEADTTIPLAPGYALRRDVEKRLWSICLPGHKWVATDLIDADARAFAAAIAPVSADPAGVEGLAELSRKATPGPWEVDAEPTDGSYGSGEDCHEGFDAYTIYSASEQRYGKPAAIMGTENSGVGLIEEEHDEDGCHAWDEVARCNTAYVVALVNAHRSGQLVPAAQPSAAGQDVSGPGAVADGFWIAPHEPTEVMLDAAWEQTGESQKMREQVHARMKRYYALMKAAAPTPPATAPGGAADPNSWEANVKHMLANCPHAVRVCEGGGPEDLKSSLVVTFAKMQASLAAVSNPPARAVSSDGVIKVGAEVLVRCVVIRGPDPHNDLVSIATKPGLNSGSSGFVIRISDIATAPGGAAGADEYGSREGFLAGEWEGPERGGAALMTSGPSRGPSSTAAGAVSVEEMERLRELSEDYRLSNENRAAVRSALRRIAASQAKDGVREGAPDLLEALFRLKSECEIEGLQSKPGFDCWVSMANEALAKAGRSDMAATRSAASALKSPANPEKPGQEGEGSDGLYQATVLRKFEGMSSICPEGSTVFVDPSSVGDLTATVYLNADRKGAIVGVPLDYLSYPSPAPQHDGEPEVGA